MSIYYKIYYNQLGGNYIKGSSMIKSKKEKDREIIISCGESHTLVLIDNKLYSFGDNKKGQLGFSDRNTQYTPKPITKFKDKDTKTRAKTVANPCIASRSAPHRAPAGQEGR